MVKFEFDKLRNRNSQGLLNPPETRLARTLWRFVDAPEEVSSVWIILSVDGAPCVPNNLGDNVQISNRIEELDEISEFLISRYLLNKGLAKLPPILTRGPFQFFDLLTKPQNLFLVYRNKILLPHPGEAQMI